MQYVHSQDPEQQTKMLKTSLFTFFIFFINYHLMKHVPWLVSLAAELLIILE